MLASLENCLSGPKSTLYSLQLVKNSSMGRDYDIGKLLRVHQLIVTDYFRYTFLCALTKGYSITVHFITVCIISFAYL